MSLIFQSTFFGANEFSDLEGGISRQKAAKVPACMDTHNLYQVTSSLSLSTAAVMHGLAAYYSLQELQKNENPNVHKALIASVIGNGAAATGDALAAIVAPFSGKGAAKILTFTYGVSFWIANVSSWVAIGFENDTGRVGQDLTTSACLSSLSIIPATVGICSSFAANNDGH